MLKLFYALCVGLVGAAIIHIAVIFLMPRVASNDAWSRLSRLGDIYEHVMLDALLAPDTGPLVAEAGSDRHGFVFMDPAFITAGCRFSIENGPVRLQAPGGRTDFWTASVYSRQGINLYSINQRSAVDGAFDLVIGTPDQLVEMSSLGLLDERTVIPVEITGSSAGYLTLRALVDEESQRPEVDAFVRSLSCDPVARSAVPVT